MSWYQGADHWIAVSPACLSLDPLFRESPPLSIWLELAKGGTERGVVSASPRVVHRRDDRLMASAGRPPQVRGPRLCTAAHSSPQPTARFLATGLQRWELLRATASQKIFTLYSSQSRSGSRKWSDIQLSFPDCAPSPVLYDERFVTLWPPNSPFETSVPPIAVQCPNVCNKFFYPLTLMTSTEPKYMKIGHHRQNNPRRNFSEQGCCWWIALSLFLMSFHVGEPHQWNHPASPPPTHISPVDELGVRKWLCISFPASYSWEWAHLPKAQGKLALSLTGWVSAGGLALPEVGWAWPSDPGLGDPLATFSSLIRIKDHILGLSVLFLYISQLVQTSIGEGECLLLGSLEPQSGLLVET